MNIHRYQISGSLNLTRIKSWKPIARWRKDQQLQLVTVLGNGNRSIDHLASGSPDHTSPLDPLPKKMGGSIQSDCYESNHKPIRRPIAGLRDHYARWSEVRTHLPDASECL
jgi:hypothetical protein